MVIRASVFALRIMCFESDVALKPTMLGAAGYWWSLQSDKEKTILSLVDFKSHLILIK